MADGVGLVYDDNQAGMQASKSTASPQDRAPPALDSRRQPKKRLLICCDGTSNNSISTDGPLTNVSRLSRCIDDVADNGGTLQVIDYHAGIGSGSSKYANVADAVTGNGINHIVRNVYTFVCLNYKGPEDEIYLIGFSRGAYTVRCLASFIGSVGLLTKAGLVHITAVYQSWKASGTTEPDNSNTYWGRFFTGKTPERDEDPSVLEQQLQYLEGLGYLRRSIPIEACAVWDTVSALGLPKVIARPFYRVVDTRRFKFDLVNPMPGLQYTKLAFIDSQILPTLKNIFHALALNEEREDYTPVTWADNSGPTRIKQCWFLGAHSDIGGGNKDIGLANITLIWMVAQLPKYTGLSISDDSLKNFLVPETLGGLQEQGFITHKQKDGSDPSKAQTGITQLTNRLPIIVTKGKVTNSRKGKFLLAGVKHRSLGKPAQRKLPLWTRSVLGKLEKPHRTSASMDRKSTPEIKQTIHFSVRVTLAKFGATCSLLGRRKTEILVDDASAATEPKVVWRVSDHKRKLPKFLSNEVEIFEEEMCDEEWELLDKWLNHWTKARSQQQHGRRHQAEGAEDTKDPQSSTTVTGTRASTETGRLTAGPNIQGASLATFSRPLLNETRSPREMYIGKPQ